MTWRFTRPDDWQELTGSPIPHDPEKSMEEYLKDAGYVEMQSSKPWTNKPWLGTWKLYIPKVQVVGLPAYLLLVGDGTGAHIEVWLHTFADLMEYMRLYNHVGK
jgi:hypothetical protein